MSKFNENLKFIYDPVKRNFGSRGKSRVQYIVVHDTGNTGRGANAKAHRNYVENNTRMASAHMFVDNNYVVQYVGDSKSAFAVGDGHGKYGIYNFNSFSVELCINQDEDYNTTFYNGVEVVKNLMEHFGLSDDRVVRHYDASRKSCPNSMKPNNWEKWWKFKELIKEPIYLKFDFDKFECTGQLVNAPKVEPKIEPTVEKGVKINYYGKDIVVDGKNESGTNYVAVRELFEKLGHNVSWKDGKVIVSDEKIEDDKSSYSLNNGLHTIKAKAKNIKISLANGKPLLKNGINGGFFNVSNPGGKDSCWGIAMQDNKPLNINSYVSNYEGKYRGTLIFDGEKVTFKRIYNIKSEWKGNVKWAISGFSMKPTYAPKEEGILDDVLRKTNHSAIGFEKDNIYLFAMENIMFSAFRTEIFNQYPKLEGLIGLDGGGSTQLRHEKPLIRSTRGLNHFVEVLY